MAKIVDPDSLNQGIEVVFDTGAKTVQLLVAGNLDDTAPGKTSGVTGKALYSFGKEEWLVTPGLRKFRFPFKMIYEGSFIFTNGWAPADQQTRDLIRDAGFLEQVTNQINTCLVSLGDIYASTDLATIQRVVGWTPTLVNLDKGGELNECYVSHDGTTDYTGYAKVRLRVPSTGAVGKEYSEFNLITGLGVTALTYQAYSFNLLNKIDIKINESDANIDANAPYTGMSITYLIGSGFTTWASGVVYPAGAVVLDAIRQSGGSSNGTWWFTPTGGTSSGTGTADDTGVTDWESYNGAEQIGTEWFCFNRIITCNSGTDQEVYNWGQRTLRRTTDINANNTPSVNQRGFGAVNGEAAALLGSYIGDTLHPEPGVLLRGFNANSTNSIKHHDITVDGGGLDSESLPVTSTERSFPFVAAGTFQFKANIVAENPNNIYEVFFEEIVLTGADTTISVGTPAGAAADIGWAGTVLDHLNVADYIIFSGFTNVENNGLWYVNSTGANTLNATKQDQNPVAETAGASVISRQSPFESPGAVIVNDNAGSPMTGAIANSSIAWDFDYTNNAQGGRTPNSDASIHVVAMALNGAEWTEATHTITAATGQSVPINPNDELNYSNPV